MTTSYLAIGDSYTIGEQVPLFESFPYQAVQILREKQPESHYLAPEILAKTGWTTDELMDAIKDYRFLPEYGLVTLLIGVNNQYRGRSIDHFREECKQLLSLAIQFAGNKTNHVFMLSIPDWGVTPFAAGKETQKIHDEIDAYNKICAELTREAGVIFIDITGSQRADGHLPEFLAADGLHPNGKEYAKWAKQLTEKILLT